MGKEGMRFVEDQQRDEAARASSIHVEQNLRLSTKLLEQQKEIEHRDALLAETAEILRVVITKEPIDPVLGRCVYCDTHIATFSHEIGCPIRLAKALLDKLT